MTSSTNDETAWSHALQVDLNAVEHEGTSPTRRPRPGHGPAAVDLTSPPTAVKADPWERALDGPPFAR